MKKSELKNGAIVELRNGDRCFKIDNTLIVLQRNTTYIFGWLSLKEYEDNLIYKGLKEFDIMKVDNDVMVGNEHCLNVISKVVYKWTWVREEKPKRILTPKEYKYLKAVIEPVKDRVKCIRKRESLVDDDLEFIRVFLNENNDITLYKFIKDTQFKGMELNKKYSLEELGL